MNRYVGVTVIAFSASCFLGCGSTDSAKPPADMDQMAAMLDKQQAKQQATDNAPSTSGSEITAEIAAAPMDHSSQPEVSTKIAPPTAADPALPKKRGYTLNDRSNEAAYVLMKADAGKVAENLAKQWNGQVLKDIFGKPVDEEFRGVIVYQLAGHPWSIFACDNSQIETLAPELSREADVLVCWYVDFNGWEGIDLYRGGEQVEAVHWGGLEEKLGEDADDSRWDAHAEITRNNEDFSFTDAFLFRSKLRKTTTQELQKGEAFVDSLFRHHDAYLPDLDDMPWVDHNKSINSPLGGSAFAGVHAVVIAE